MNKFLKEKVNSKWQLKISVEIYTINYKLNTYLINILFLNIILFKLS